MSGTPEVWRLEKFIADYPKSSFIENVKNKLHDVKEKEAFIIAENNNTKESYNRFIIDYPNGDLNSKAKIRLLETDTEAFLTTCGIGTAEAFRGYAKWRSESTYASIAKFRAEYIMSVDKGDHKVYKKFIDEYPANPFVYEAIANYPLLWLMDIKDDIGVIIDVGNIIKWKGLFGGLYVTKDEVAMKSFNKLKEDMEIVGIKAIYYIPDGVSIKNNSVVIKAKYDEIEKSVITSNDAVGKGAWLLEKIVSPTFISKYSLTIMDTVDNTVYYENVNGLTEKVSSINVLNALHRYKDMAIPSFMVALGDKDPFIRVAAIQYFTRYKDNRVIEILKRMDSSGLQVDR